MSRTLTVIAVSLLGLAIASDALAQNGGNGNGAKVGKDGYLLNVIAFDNCPDGDFKNTNRHMIAVQSGDMGQPLNKSYKTNKIFLKKGDDFDVYDGNACDGDGARFFLPITEDNCMNCNGGDVEPTFREYEVWLRLVGKPGGHVKITSCVEVEVIIEDETTYETLCSVGMENIVVETRYVGRGKEQNKWENVSKQLLTVCVDTDDTDGVEACTERVGLFDYPYGVDYWWNWGADGRAHAQLVFVPADRG